jgi:hypothetical protein
VYGVELFMLFKIGKHQSYRSTLLEVVETNESEKLFYMPKGVNKLCIN